MGFRNTHPYPAITHRAAPTRQTTAFTKTPPAANPILAHWANPAGFPKYQGA